MPAVSATDICDGLAVTAQQCPRMLDERDLLSRVPNQNLCGKLLLAACDTVAAPEAWCARAVFGADAPLPDAG